MNTQKEIAMTTKVLKDIADERSRQINVEGFTRQHDDAERASGELIRAAGCFLAAVDGGLTGALTALKFVWPFDPESFKPDLERQLLVKAAALIAAEIERRDRAEAKR
jgi:hypothetical protein